MRFQFYHSTACTIFHSFIPQRIIVTAMTMSWVWYASRCEQNKRWMAGNMERDPDQLLLPQQITVNCLLIRDVPAAENCQQQGHLLLPEAHISHLLEAELKRPGQFGSMQDTCEGTFLLPIFPCSWVRLLGLYPWVFSLYPILFPPLPSLVMISRSLHNKLPEQYTLLECAS